jgi:hypothetical protein
MGNCFIENSARLSRPKPEAGKRKGAGHGAPKAAAVELI